MQNDIRYAPNGKPLVGHISYVRPGCKPALPGIKIAEQTILVGRDGRNLKRLKRRDVYIHSRAALDAFVAPAIRDGKLLAAAVKFALSLREIDGARDFLEAWTSGAPLDDWADRPAYLQHS